MFKFFILMKFFLQSFSTSIVLRFVHRDASFPIERQNCILTVSKKLSGCSDSVTMKSTVMILMDSNCQNALDESNVPMDILETTGLAPWISAKFNVESFAKPSLLILETSRQ